jgi:hypothetical protein
MWRKRSIKLAAAVSLSMAAMAAGVMAAPLGGGHSGGSGAPRFSGGGVPHFNGVGVPHFSGGNFNHHNVLPGLGGNRNAFGPSLKGNPGVPGNLAGRHVFNGGRSAWIGGHRAHGRRIYGFIPGYGYGYYWYYNDCYVWTDYGWINMCGYDGPFVY